MRYHRRDTPPPSIYGDDMPTTDEEEIMFLGNADDFISSGEEDDMEEVIDEEDIDMEAFEDNSYLLLKQHVGSVFCCDLHVSGKFGVTGGEDDKAFVWDLDNGQVVTELVGFKDSVVVAAFSFDGVFLATADMLGNIKVFECKFENQDNEPWKIVFEQEIGDINWGFWHFGARVLFFGTESGQIYVFKIPSGETKVLQSNNVKVGSGKLFPDGQKLAAGYNDGSIKVWDIKTQKVLQTIQSNVEEQEVTQIDIHPDNNLIAAIVSNEKIMLSLSSGKIVGDLATQDALEYISFSSDPEIGFLASGTLNGEVAIWDVSRQMIRNHCSKHEEDVGITKNIWVKDKLVTGCLNGTIRVYNGKSGTKLESFHGHSSEILDFCCSAEHSLIMTVSDDGTGRIFKYDFNKDVS